MPSFRGIAERLTHRIVLRRRLPVPFRQVRMYVSSEAGLKYLKPSLSGVDPGLLSVAADTVKRGDVVWDIGANIGLFALTAASSAGATGQVVAIEADTRNVDMLRRSCSVQPPASADITVVPVAMGDRVGFASFRIATRNRSTNALAGFGSSQMGGEREVQTVPMSTLDELLAEFDPPDVLKIDVEGAELLVLAGAERVLASRPIILCEVEGDHTAEFLSLLENYTIFDFDAAPPRRPVTECPYNVLALPN